MRIAKVGDTIVARASARAYGFPNWLIGTPSKVIDAEVLPGMVAVKCKSGLTWRVKHEDYVISETVIERSTKSGGPLSSMSYSDYYQAMNMGAIRPWGSGQDNQYKMATDQPVMLAGGAGGGGGGAWGPEPNDRWMYDGLSGVRQRVETSEPVKPKDPSYHEKAARYFLSGDPIIKKHQDDIITAMMLKQATEPFMWYEQPFYPQPSEIKHGDLVEIQKGAEKVGVPLQCIGRQLRVLASENGVSMLDRPEVVHPVFVSNKYLKVIKKGAAPTAATTQTPSSNGRGKGQGSSDEVRGSSAGDRNGMGGGTAARARKRQSEAATGERFVGHTVSDRRHAGKARKAAVQGPVLGSGSDGA